MKMPAFEIDRLLRPQTMNDLQAFVGLAASRRGVDVQRLPLRPLRTADAEPGQQPPLRQHVDRRALLGQQHRIAHRQRHHVDAELDAPSPPGDRGQRRHALQDRLTADQPVGLPQRVDPACLAQIDPSPESGWAAEREFHQPEADGDAACHKTLRCNVCRRQATV